MSQIRISLPLLLVFVYAVIGYTQDWEFNHGKEVELHGFGELREFSSWHTDFFVFEYGAVRLEDIDNHTRLFAQKANGSWHILGRERRRQQFSDSHMVSNGSDSVYSADCHGSAAFVRRFELQRDDNEITGYSMSETNVEIEGRHMHQCALAAKGHFVVSIVAGLTSDENKPAELYAVCSSDNGATWQKPVKIGEAPLACFMRLKLAVSVAPNGAVSVYDIGLDDDASNRVFEFREVFTKHSGYIKNESQAKLMLKDNYTVVRHSSNDNGKTWTSAKIELADSGARNALRVPVQTVFVNGAETLLYILVSTDQSIPDRFFLAKEEKGSGGFECDLLTNAYDAMIGDPLSFQRFHVAKTRLACAGSHLVFVQYQSVGAGNLWLEWRPMVSEDGGRTWDRAGFWNDQPSGGGLIGNALHLAVASDDSHVVLSSNTDLSGRNRATFKLGSYGPPAVVVD